MSVQIPLLLFASSVVSPQALAILAILNTRGAFLPLDPDDPTLRKEMLIVDINAKILLHILNVDTAVASKATVSRKFKEHALGE